MQAETNTRIYVQRTSKSRKPRLVQIYGYGDSAHEDIEEAKKAGNTLVAGGEALDGAARRILAALAGGPFIFNLGHGITPDADPENVQLMIDTVRGG